MADQQRWWKMWGSILTDDDILQLPAADRWAWAALGTYIKIHGTRGVIHLSHDNPALAVIFDVPKSTVIDVLKRLPHVSIEEGKSVNGKITVTFRNWHKYQEDSTISQRVTRLRSKKREEENRIRIEKNKNTTQAIVREKTDEPHQVLINRFLDLQGFDRANRDIVTGAYKRHSRSALALIKESGGVKYALAALEWGAGYFGRKGLDWTLDTIAKHLPTFARCGRNDLLATQYGLNREQVEYARELSAWLGRGPQQGDGGEGVGVAQASLPNLATQT